MSETKLDTLEIEIEASSSEATKRIKELTAALKELREETTRKFENPIKQLEGAGTQSFSEKRAAKEKQASQSSDEQIIIKAPDVREFAESIEEVQDNAEDIKETLENTSLGTADDFLKANSQMDILQRKAESLKSALDKALGEGDKEKADQLAEKYIKVTSQIKKIGEESDKSAKKVNNLTAAFKKVTSFIPNVKKLLIGNFNPFSGLKKSVNEVGLLGIGLRKLTSPIRSVVKEINKWKSSIGRIAFYRAIRSAIKMVTEGFKEGSNNLYKYSSLMNTSFAPAMNSLATSSLYLKNSLGAMAAPLIEAVAPAVDFLIDKFVALLNVIGKVFSALTGKGTFTQAKKQATQFGDAIDSAAGSAKKLQDYMLGIDELNVISPDTGSGGGGAGSDLDYSSMFEEVEIDSKIADFAQSIKDAISSGDWGGAGKILADNLNDLASEIEWDELGTKIGEKIQNAISFGLGFMRNFDFESTGGGAATLLNNLFDNINQNDYGALLASKITAAVDFAFGFVTTFDWAENGQWLGEVVNGWFDEIDWDKTGETIGKGISGALTYGLEFLKTVDKSEIIEDLKDLIVGIWEGLGENQGLATGIAAAISAWKFGPTIVKAFGKLLDLGAATNTASGATSSVGELSESVGSGGSGLNGKLVSLAQNLGLGIGIIGEVAIAAGLIVGAVIGLGYELQFVADAWQPVIDNAGTVATTMGVGVGILAVVGAVTAGLGSVGTPLIVNIALGTAILAELGVAAGLFLVEIWGIGKGLDEIGKAWEPVLKNGGTIATAIGIGTGLLVGIGVVAAALGAATVASAGLLPLAIGLGTALLVELGEAFQIFFIEITGVAKSLSDDLAPALDKLNGELPSLTTNMSDFVDFMGEFAGQVVRYSESSIVAGISGTIDTIVGWFTVDPFKKLADDAKKTYEQVVDLNGKLALAVPELEEASRMLSSYQSLIDEIMTLAGSNNNTVLSSNMLVNMKKVGENLVTGFSDGITKSSSKFKNAISNMEKTMRSFKSNVSDIFDDISTGAWEKWESMADDISRKNDEIRTKSENTWKSIRDSILSSVNGLSKSIGNEYGKITTEVSNKLSGLKTAINNSFSSANSAATTQANNLKNNVSYVFSGIYNTAFNWGADICAGLANGMNKYASRVYAGAYGLAKTIYDMLHFSEPEIGPLSNFHTYMPDMLDLMAKGIKNNAHVAYSAVAEVASGISDSIQSINPASISVPIHTNYHVGIPSGYDGSVNGSSDEDDRSFNDGIVSAIYDIASMVITAINEKDSDVYLDGKKVTNEIKKIQRRRGANIMMGGAY